MQQKPNGRPKSQRNIQIIADYKSGMTSLELAKKYGMTRGYIQKLASEYQRKNIMLKVDQAKNPCTLFASRDKMIINAYFNIEKRA